MNKELEWLDMRIQLLQYREAMQIQIDALYQELQAVSFLVPLQEIFLSSFSDLEGSVEKMKNHLQALISIPTPIPLLGMEVWEEQYRALHILQDQLYAHKKELLSYQELLSKMDSNQMSLELNWKACPGDVFSSVYAHQEADVLLQFRVDLLLEEELDDRNPAHVPFLIADIRHQAKSQYLGLDLGISIVDTHTEIKASEILQFQVEWLARLPKLLQAYSVEELSEIEIPTLPYTKEAITRVLSQLQSIQSKRPRLFSLILRKKYRIDTDLLSKHNLAMRLCNGQPFLEMVYVESRQHCLSSKQEKPDAQHLPFWISIFPVTVDLYSFFVPRKNRKEYQKDYPVTSISWFQALGFCNVLSKKDGLEPCYQLGIGPQHVVWNRNASGYRLPTEVEWEMAAQPGLQNIASSQKHMYIWAGKDVRNTSVVGTKKPNHRGLFDMLGNVWEWCYKEKVGKNPLVNDSREQIVRGGSWKSIATEIHVGIREGREVAGAFEDVGFRIVRNADITKYPQHSAAKGV